MKPAAMNLALMLAITAALAVASTSAFAKGDPVEGKKLVYTCTGCHGIDGYKNAYPNYHVPRLGGQNEQYLVNALTEYKKGERAHPTMRAQAESFSDKDIANIAAYHSSVGTEGEKRAACIPQNPP
jgi:cytochrome c553